MFKKSVTLHVAHSMYLWVSYDYHNQPTIVSKNRINELICIMEKCCVLFEVWNARLITISTSFAFKR